jgi:hypothetical protein
MIGHEATVKRSMEDRFGAMTDALVRHKGLVIDRDSRDRVLHEVSKALDQAASQLKKYADGELPLTLGQTASLPIRAPLRSASAASP